MPFQMALDELLFRRMIEDGTPRESQSPLVRFYYSSEPWISLGYSYAGWKHPGAGAENAAEGNGNLPVCRRLTGGGRVLHGRDIMFTLIAPKAAHGSFSSVSESYLAIHEAVKSAIEDMGHKPRFYRDEELARGKDCFLFPITTDLGVGGEKVAGGGQKRSLGIMLHQESIRAELLGDPEIFREHLERRFEEIFAVTLEPAPFWPELFLQAEKLGAEKYRVDPVLKHA